MTSLKLTVLLVCLQLVGCGITAPHRNAGYADLDGLSWRDVDATMTISLGPTLLSMAAQMVEDDPQTKALLRSLDGVRIKIYEIEDDPDSVVADLNSMSSQLREEGWEPVMLVREERETVHVLMKLHEDRIAGLTVLTTDSVEVVLVNVMGELRPDLFSETMAALDVPTPDIDV